MILKTMDISHMLSKNKEIKNTKINRKIILKIKINMNLIIIIITNRKHHCTNRDQVIIRNKNSIIKINTTKTHINANQAIKMIIEKPTILKIMKKIEEILQEAERMNSFPLKKYKSLVDKILRVFWKTLKLLENLRI